MIFLLLISFMFGYKMLMKARHDELIVNELIILHNHELIESLTAIMRS